MSAQIMALRSFLESKLYLRRGALFLLRAYQIWVSPWLPPACRFYPSCSAYMMEAIERKGLFPGLGLGIRRLLRCHPFHPGGMDPLK